MPRPPDNPESTNSLHTPELNPLLNPVLGAHMGRWAEVYFTNPPEKRDEAVIQLLRELVAEAEPTFQESAHRMIPEISRQHEPAFTSCASCASCGEPNPLDQKFCGMCGAEMYGAEMSGTEVSPGRAPEGRPPIVGLDQDEIRGLFEVSHGNGRDSRDRNPFGKNRAVDDGPKLLPDYEPVPYRYRVYLGAVLALLLSTLLYMAWRSTQAGLRISHPLPSAAPAATPDLAAQPPTPAAPKADSPKGPLHKKTPEVTSTAEAASASSRPTTAGQVPAGQTTSESGSEELAIAQNYLGGTQGKARDEGEAAKWLWKAVGKQNAAAALTLSDLYLRGNGVSKNCDQARLLLDAAARKGTAGAAERLRNLQAFGCQ